MNKYKTITREQFLFKEMKIIASLLSEGFSNTEILDKVYQENLFQYPTERMIKNIANVCLKRYETLNDTRIVELVSNSSNAVGKQACVFVMMENYQIVSDFMITVIGEKYKTRDYTFTPLDMNTFFARMQQQNDIVTSWSEETIKKSKSVLKKLLVDNDYLDNHKSTVLNPLLLDHQLKEIIEDHNKSALIAFNCFE